MFMGDRLREQRIRRGLSQQQLGDVLGVSRSAIQKQESGKSKSIDTASLELLANRLNCSPAYLMGWTDDPDAGLQKEPAINEHGGFSEIKKALLNKVAVMSDDDVDALSVIVERVIQRRRE